MKRVLVINDDADFQYLMKTYLERQGFIAHTINDDEAIIEKVKEIEPDLILLDVQAERDKAICQELQKHGIVEKTRLVLLIDKEVPKDLKCKPHAIIEKPFQPDKFLWKIKKLF